MRVTAPGKLMLMGEHAVVYGQPCIVTAIDQRLTVSVQEVGDVIDIRSPQSHDTRYADAAIAAAIQKWNLSIPGLLVETESSFSGKYGFGSSAAVTVGVITAIAGTFGKTPTHEEIFDIGFSVIQTVQGAGSGFDIAAAVWGGTLWFSEKGAVVEDLPGFRDCALVVGYSGVKADTSALIADVAKKRESDAQKVERIFAGIGELVMQGKEAYVAGDWERLGTFMNFNQDYLRDLGVSRQKLEDLISAAKAAGAWGAKLSGAGGGDCMIAIGPSDKQEAIQEAIRGAGGEVVDVTPHAEGVRVEG
jgi:mevalonate kinase